MSGLRYSVSWTPRRVASCAKDLAVTRPALLQRVRADQLDCDSIEAAARTDDGPRNDCADQRATLCKRQPIPIVGPIDCECRPCPANLIQMGLCCVSLIS